MYMYISNQKRLRRYRKDRDAEERNSDATQLRLYELLAQEAGEEEQASRLANMARRIGSQILDPSEPSEAVGSIDPIVAAIKWNYLDKLIKEFRALPFFAKPRTPKYSEEPEPRYVPLEAKRAHGGDEG
ncbi:hypothetical protein GN958_ATG23295 [Phytophthora infestans]|uniref:Uncharacterized protein n=2 Tax=Phytophthora infestans TaxID=4787 RepID=A0A8S9TH75_PHYIN|nr:hypothetical protein GN958_ATG23295 [Phytophthora infestans]